MTDKQIIIDGIKTSKEDFIDNFAIELTNRNIFEREQIGDKYFEIILRKEQECEELKKANDSILTTLNVIAKGNIKLRQTLAEIKEIADEKAKVNDWLALEILEKINEVEDALAL